MTTFAKGVDSRDALIRMMMRLNAHDGDPPAPIDCAACGAANAEEIGICTTGAGAHVGYVLCKACRCYDNEPTEQTLEAVGARIEEPGPHVWLEPIIASRELTLSN